MQTIVQVVGARPNFVKMAGIAAISTHEAPGSTWEVQVVPSGPASR
jgi:hypothetical protein